MGATRKLTTIVAADIVGYSRLASADEERTVARVRALRGDLIDPAIAAHRGRVVKRTGDGTLMEFRSVVDAVRCAIKVQNGMVERNAGLPPERQIRFRVGVHLGDVIEEADGDLMGDGVNIAARLEGICEPGAICLSEDAYRQVRARLDLAVTDLGDRDLKNIPEPVRVYALSVGQPATARAAAQNSSVVPAKAGTQGQRTSPAPDSRLRGNDEKGKARRRSVPIPTLAAAVAALVVIAAVGAWFALKPPPEALRASSLPRGTGEGQGGGVAEAKHLSIVVLPFQNLSGDSKQDYFADGITDNLTTDLSRIRNSFVIARNTAFTYKGKAVDAKEIGKDLGVRYVLEGSVARDGNRVRVNAQLIDAESGSHLWADRFEEDLADLFKLQDDVVARLANALGYELTKAEAAKAAHSANPDAIDLAMQGWALENQPVRRDLNKQAEDIFERALELAPENTGALAGAANAYARDFSYGWGEASVDYNAKIIARAERAIAGDPNSAMAYYAKGFYLADTHRSDDGLATIQTGIQNNPNAASLYDARALVETHLAMYREALSDEGRALQLSPRDPHRGVWFIFRGNAELELGENSAAVESDRRGIEAGYRTVWSYCHLAAAYAQSNKMEEARAALSEARRMQPDVSIKWLMKKKPASPRFYEGLRKAGMPEQ